MFAGGDPTKFNAPDKAIATRDTGQWVQHDLGAFAAQERSDEFGCPVIAKSKNWVTKYGDKVGVGCLRCKIPDENAVFLRILLLLLLHTDWNGDGGRWHRGSRRDGRRPVEDERLCGIGHRERLT
jgi:hypothetical protein